MTNQAQEVASVLTRMEAEKAEMDKQRDKLASDQRMLDLKRTYLKAGRDQLEVDRGVFNAQQLRSNSEDRQLQRKFEAAEKRISELEHDIHDKLSSESMPRLMQLRLKSSK